MTSEDEDENDNPVSKEVKKSKGKLGGGDPIDVNPSHGTSPIELAFSSKTNA